MKRNCKNREEWLGSYIYKDLPLDAEMSAEEHLKDCAACLAEVESMRKFVAWLPQPKPVPGRRRGYIPALAAAAALLFGIVIGRGTIEKQRTVPVVESKPTTQTAAPVNYSDMISFLKNGKSKLPEDARAKLDALLRK